MIDVELTSMEDTHLSDVLAIERRVFDTPWTEEMFRQEIRGVFGSRATVARIGQRIAGYQIAWFIDDEVHLVNIAVDKRYRHQGIGTLLLRHLIDESLATGKMVITLEVRASNAGAQAFYRRFLFRTIGVRKGYYSDNREDALLMILDLTQYSQRRSVREGGSRAG